MRYLTPLLLAAGTLLWTNAADAAFGDQLFKVLPIDGAAEDEFGYSLAVAGGIVAVGARLDDDNGMNSGSAYLFDASTGAQIAKLLPEDGAAGDEFGFSIAIDNNVVAVGARSDDDNGAGSGSVYLFNALTGDQLVKLLPEDGTAGDEFGYSVAIDNGIVAVGAMRDDDLGDSSGSAYLFDASTGAQLDKLLPDTGAANQNFGVSIAMDDGVVVMGARTYFVLGEGFTWAKAYLFDVSTGDQINRLQADIENYNGDWGGSFGDAVDIENGLVVVGAWARSIFFDHSGAAYVFDASTGEQLAFIFPSDGHDRDHFGISVSIDNGVVAIGAHQDGDNGFNAGSAYLFDALTGAQVDKLLASDGAAFDLFGSSIGIDSGVLAIGAYRDDDGGEDSGSAYVFDVDDLACPADLAGDDGDVGFSDLLVLLSAWDSDGPGADLAEPLDVVGFSDLLVLLSVGRLPLTFLPVCRGLSEADAPNSYMRFVWRKTVFMKKDRTGSLDISMLLLAVVAILPGVCAGADPDYSWTYYRPGNTGVMGDYSDGLWIDPQGTLYLGGYSPFFEEGGFSRFLEAENRWENFSNVDYPVIGDPAFTGSAHISDFCPDANGALWMGTWRGALYFDPAIGPDSLVRYDAGNSPMPGGRTMDVSIAPDGSVWFACYGNGGGLVRYVPDTEAWTVWGYGDTANDWPGWTTLDTAVVQPKPSAESPGGYLVWIDDAFGIAQFDSDTGLFTELANLDVTGEIESILPNGTDETGNTWMLRYTTPGQLYTLEYRRPDGSWVAPPMPFAGAIELGTFRAFGDREALMVALGSQAWHFDGASWSNLGEWRPGGFTYAIDMDAEGNVWVSGNGGAGRRDAETGQWQRYRLTNTGLLDNWVRDISFAPNGDVWVTENGGPGTGGIGVFDGQRWHNHNVLTYGLGEEWPFPTDNADAITYRASTGNVAFNPMFNGIREWDGEAYSTLETGSTSDGLVEDSDGRLWTMGNYFSLRYHDGNGFQSVPIAGWGRNIVRDPDRPGTVWGCANLEVVRTDGAYLYARQNVDLPELNPMHDVLTTVAAAPDGIAWVGSTEGLFRLDAEAGTHQWWHSSNSDLPGDQVTPLVASPDGRVWFTNFNSNGIEASLVWFDGTEFGTITRAQGLPHAQIYDAEVRNAPGGYEIWLACASRGIAVLTVEMSGVVGDVDGDGAVGFSDLLVLLADWGPCEGCPTDLDGDGDVGFGDLLILLSNWSA